MFIKKEITDTDVWKGGNKKRFLILHHTASSPKTTFENIVNFFKRKDYISIHYVVGREGQITQLADENDRCFHAGVSEWKGEKNINNSSIGIEVLSDGKHFTREQVQATHWLIKDIIGRNNISIDNVLRHADVAIPRGRKTDIGENFFRPNWGSWEAFQMSLAVHTASKNIKGLESRYARQARVVNSQLERFNKIKKELAEAKGVPFIPHKIV